LPDREEPAVVNLDLAAARSHKQAVQLRFAADLIRRDGYNPSKPADSGPGHSLSTALCTVTGCDPTAKHIPACEDLHGRVAGYLHLSGRARTGQAYLPDVVRNWEDWQPGEGRRTQAEAAGVLDHAGAILTRASNQPAGSGSREWEELRARAITAAFEITGNTGLAEASADAVLSVRDDAARERMTDQLMEAFRIRSMDFRAGAAMDLVAAREMAAVWVGAARGLIGDAANYTEMEVALAGDPGRYIFRLERCGHLTPHQARLQAEERATRAETAIARLRDTLTGDGGQYSAAGDALTCTRCNLIIRDAAIPGDLLAQAVTHIWTCYGPDDEPEPDEYDPGPEVDDEGGMSEYRHYYEPQPWQ
jgi:hypothetical protein